MRVKFWASSRSLGGVATSVLITASRTPSAGWRRGFSCFHGAIRDSRRGNYLPEGRPDTVGVCALDLPQDTLVFGGCLHTRHPACCSGRFRDWVELSWAERTAWALCVMQKEPVGWFDVLKEQPEWAEFRLWKSDIEVSLERTQLWIPIQCYDILLLQQIGYSAHKQFIFSHIYILFIPSLFLFYTTLSSTSNISFHVCTMRIFRENKLSLHSVGSH